MSRWSAVTAATRSWAISRQPREGDIPLTLYRDANGWCPHCHKVFWYMEQLALRYTTARIHLQGDPREPPKQKWFLTDVNPSGSVPVLQIRDEILPESLHILRRLEREFASEHGHVVTVPSDDAWADKMVHASDHFDCDADGWLQNLDEEQEETLFEQTLAKLRWLNEQLGRHGGPFLLGAKPSLLDGMYVGFLTRAATNYLFFKQLDIRDPSAGLPRLVVWLEAMQQSRGGQRTWQPPSNDQRVYQSHPARRCAAEPCQQLHPSRLGISETSDWAAQLSAILGAPPGHEPLSCGSPAALEAAQVIADRCTALASFLLRKVGERAAGPQYWQGKRHPRAGGTEWQCEGQGMRWVGRYPPPYARPNQRYRWPATGLSQKELQEQMAAVEADLLQLAVTLAGLSAPSRLDKESPVVMLVDTTAEDGSLRAGELLLAPAFMSAAAEAQVEAALKIMRRL